MLYPLGSDIWLIEGNTNRPAESALMVSMSPAGPLFGNCSVTSEYGIPLLVPTRITTPSMEAQYGPRYGAGAPRARVPLAAAAFAAMLAISASSQRNGDTGTGTGV